MIKSEQEEFKKEFREIKMENIEEFLVVSWHILLRIIETNSFKSNYKLLNNLFKSINEENYILDFLKNNLKIIDSNALNEYLDQLDAANTEMIEYIYDLLDGEKETDFKFLPEKKEYRKEAYSLTLTNKEIKKFLDYPNDFWKYTESRTYIVENDELYGVTIKDDTNNIVKDIRIFVPEITNLYTAKVYIHEMKHAYDLYNMLGNKYVNKDYEENARALEKEFENKYLVKKIQS